ncbi:14381_t:CDS:2 [Funneliformis geosporum]|nr:14381_t:CDS:2 [Funneliformis geosporum]
MSELQDHFATQIQTSHMISNVSFAQDKKVQVLQGHQVYTYKTRSCGQFNDKLGGSKDFWCYSCKVTMDQDANGVTQVVNGRSGFGLTLGLESIWDTI